MKEFIITLERKNGPMFWVKCDSINITFDYIFFKKGDYPVCSIRRDEIFEMNEYINCEAVKIEF